MLSFISKFALSISICLISHSSNALDRAFVSPISPTLIKNIMETFKQSKCTIILTKYMPGKEYFSFENLIIQDILASTTCSSQPALQGNYFQPEYPFPNIKFLTKYFTSCFVFVDANYITESKFESILKQNIHGYHDVTSQLVNIKRFSLSKYSSTPQYTLGILIVPSGYPENTRFLISLPEALIRSRLIIAILSTDQVNCLQKSKVYIGCWSCDKSKFSLKKRETMQIAILLPMGKDSTQTIVGIEAEYKRYSVNEKFNNFGLSHIGSNEHKKCSYILLRTIFIPHFQEPRMVFNCLRYQFFYWQNISMSTIKTYNWVYLTTCTSDDVANSYDLISPVFTSYDELSFFVVLGLNENSPLIRENKFDIIKVLFSSFSSSTWIIFGILAFAIRIILGYNSVIDNGTKNSNFQWSFWMFAVLLEQGDGELRGIFKSKNLYALGVWIMGALVLRNFYSSEMTSFFTKAPNPGVPENVPKTMDQLFDAKSPKAITTIVAAHELSQIIEKFYGCLEYENELDFYDETIYVTRNIKACQKFEKILSQIKVVEFDTDILQVSRGSKFRCLPLQKIDSESSRDVFRFWLKNSTICDTIERFAVLYLESSRHLFRKQEFISLGARAVVDGGTDSKMLSMPEFWCTIFRDVYRDYYNQFINLMTESGIYAQFEKRYREMHQRWETKWIFKKLNLKPRELKHEHEIKPASPIMLSDLAAIFLWYICLAILFSLLFIWEIAAYSFIRVLGRLFKIFLIC